MNTSLKIIGGILSGDNKEHTEGFLKYGLLDALLIRAN